MQAQSTSANYAPGCNQTRTGMRMQARTHAHILMGTSIYVLEFACTCTFAQLPSGTWVWRTDLAATQPFWHGWYAGLSDAFLKVSSVFAVHKCVLCINDAMQCALHIILLLLVLRIDSLHIQHSTHVQCEV